MSTGTRRFNFTKRQRLKREHLSIAVHQPRDVDPQSVSAALDLASYGLRPDARVFVEAYRHTTWQRFDFGTVGAVRAPEDQSLRDFGSGEGLRFRIKVVEPFAAATAAARILAQADGIIPNQDGPRKSLLPLDPDPNLRDEVWRLDIDENDGPLVKVSTHLVRDRHALARSPTFITLAFPEILRRVLTWALDDGLPADDEWESPRGHWIRFACALLGQTEPPHELDDTDDGADARERWIDDAVTHFCRTNRIDRAFGSWWREEAPGQRGGPA